MTVAELITQLRKCNQRDEVMLIIGDHVAYVQRVEPDEEARTVDLYGS